MTDVDVEYRVPCGLLEDAVDVQTALLERFGPDLEGVRLQPGHGGTFVVRVDDEVVWDRAVHGEVDAEMVTEAVEDRLHAAD